jgi:hypothetical protein
MLYRQVSMQVNILSILENYCIALVVQCCLEHYIMNYITLISPVTESDFGSLTNYTSFFQKSWSQYILATFSIPVTAPP